MNRKTWSGNFCAQARGADAWLLSATGPPSIDIHLAGVDLSAAAGYRPDAAPIECVEVHWSGEGAELTLGQGGSIRRFKARTAYVLEPQPDLYRALPLEVFGAKSRTFWQRIFLLVRIPGGRHLLKFVARRARA